MIGRFVTQIGEKVRMIANQQLPILANCKTRSVLAYNQVVLIKFTSVSLLCNTCVILVFSSFPVAKPARFLVMLCNISTFKDRKNNEFLKK